jgi:hypothetical protein
MSVQFLGTRKLVIFFPLPAAGLSAISAAQDAASIPNGTRFIFTLVQNKRFS